MTPERALLEQLQDRLAEASEADWCGATNEYADGRRAEATEQLDWLTEEMAKLEKGET